MWSYGWAGSDESGISDGSDLEFLILVIMKSYKKNSKVIFNDRICSNSYCSHKNDEHYSPLNPRSLGDPLDTSCRLCKCEGFQ